MLLYLPLLETEEQKNNFIEIYSRNRDKMYHIAFGYLRQREEAEEAVQDAFLKLADRFGRYEHLSEREMDGLCVTVVKNTALDQMGRLKRTFPAKEDVMEALYQENGAETIVFPEEMALKKETAETIRCLLKELPVIYHDILVLRYYYEVSTREAARLLGISKKTADIRLYRAKERLRKILDEKEI